MKQKVPAQDRRLAAVHEEFQEWRRSSRKGSRIPEPLWDAAAGLSGQHPVAEIARLLRLDYVKLRDRIRSLGCTGRETGRLKPAGRVGSGFVEVGVVPGRSNGESVMEVEDGTGRKLRMHLQGFSGVEVAEVAKVLWERSR